MRPGLGSLRIHRGNMALMRTLRPGFGAYFLNDDTGNIHQWTGEGWESVGCNGTPEKAAILLLLQQQAQAAADAGVGIGGGGGSTPGEREPGVGGGPGGDPSIDDPVLFVPPPAPPPLPRPGPMDPPTGTGDPMGYVPSTGSPMILDNFERVVAANSWGSVSPSGVYTYTQVLQGIAAVRSCSVSGGMGHATIARTGASIGAVIHRIINAAGPWAGTFDLTMSWYISAIPVGNGEGIRFTFSVYDAGTGNPYADCRLEISTGLLQGAVTLNDTASPTVVKVDWVAGAQYKMRWQRVLGGVSRMKLWLASVAEPAGWLLATVAPAGVVNELDLDIRNTCSFDFASYTIDIEEITFP